MREKKLSPSKPFNIFLKIYERFLHENITNYINTFLSNFFPLIASPIVPYCKSYALIRLIEKLEKILTSEKNCSSSVSELTKSF